MNKPLPVRFVEFYGRRAWLRVYWKTPGVTCLPFANEHVSEYHDARAPLLDAEGIDAMPGGEPEDHDRSEWPTKCDRCSIAVPPDQPMIFCECGCGVRIKNPLTPNYQVFREPLYATPDRSWIGIPSPGDAYYSDFYDWSDGHTTRCHAGWTNCDGKHLIVVTPDGHHWDTNGRASNCTLLLDATHRCWVRHGDPRDGTLHVDKNGETCAAGAGSIQTKEWHGFLHNGQLVQC